jgi:transcriptional regulator with XRE-family HTH domain
MAKPESSMRNRELGRQLRWAQDKAGFNGRQLATMLGWAPAVLSRTLCGRRATRDVDVSALLAVCLVIGSERDRVLRLCHPYDNPGFLRLPDEEQWSAYLAHAGDAVRLIEFQPFTVPWMVQTPDYACALLSDSPTAPPEKLAERVAVRRAAVGLVRLPRVELLLHEWLLRTPVGSVAVMRDQLHHLLQISQRPSVSVRVVPIGHGVHACGKGAFTLLEFADHAPVVHREDHGAGVLLDHHHEVDACRSTIEQLDRGALGEHPSRDLIGQIAADLYS